MSPNGRDYPCVSGQYGRARGGIPPMQNPDILEQGTPNVSGNVTPPGGISPSHNPHGTPTMDAYRTPWYSMPTSALPSGHHSPVHILPTTQLGGTTTSLHGNQQHHGGEIPAGFPMSPHRGEYFHPQKLVDGCNSQGGNYRNHGPPYRPADYSYGQAECESKF